MRNTIPHRAFSHCTVVHTYHRVQSLRQSLEPLRQRLIIERSRKELIASLSRLSIRYSGEFLCELQLRRRRRKRHHGQAERRDIIIIIIEGRQNEDDF